MNNLRYVARERNILLLWSIPPVASSPHRFKGCIVRWGLLYPGPNEAEVSLEKRAFSIEPLGKNSVIVLEIEVTLELRLPFVLQENL